MTLKAVIVADDLTGALDTGTPFVDAGLSVAVAVDVEAAQDAIATGCDVVVVNTASRALGEPEAAERVRFATAALRGVKPAVVMKKIDPAEGQCRGGEPGAGRCARPRDYPGGARYSRSGASDL